MNRYRKFGVTKVLFFLLAAAGFIFLIGMVVSFLWNAILTEATGVQPITFWQAIGLFVLSKILFSGWHHRAGGRWSGPGKRWRQKWHNMDEEERAQFKARWRERCRTRE